MRLFITISFVSAVDVGTTYRKGRALETRDTDRIYIYFLRESPL